MKTKCVYLVIIFLLPLLLLSSCHKGHKGNSRAVYYWKTTFKLSNDDLMRLHGLQIQRIYLRFFDIDLDPEHQNIPVPLSPVIMQSKLPEDIALVPVIYITNRTLDKISVWRINPLADSMCGKIKRMLDLNHIQSINEIQLDCDWTDGTRDKYFALIRRVQHNVAATGINISATIRLHQVKYSDKTGIPPVKRGMLMFYNMGKVKDIKSSNSIYDESTAKQYLYNFNNYPMHLDVVLPLFSWAAVYRGDKLIALINDVNEEDLKANHKLRKGKDNYYGVLNATFLNGQYVYPSDIIKLETITPETTASAAKLLSPYIKNDSVRVSLYHWDNKAASKYESKALDNIYNAF